MCVCVFVCIYRYVCVCVCLCVYIDMCVCVVVINLIYPEQLVFVGRLRKFYFIDNFNERMRVRFHDLKEHFSLVLIQKGC